MHRNFEVSANVIHQRHIGSARIDEQSRYTVLERPLKKFDEKDVVKKIKHYLPSQTALKDFIHHNSLHAFQHKSFFDAIFLASEIFGYQVTLQLSEFRLLYSNGRIREEVLDFILKENKSSDWTHWKRVLLEEEPVNLRNPRIGKLRGSWQSKYGINLDNEVQPILFRTLSAYLDQGIAKWSFPASRGGFIDTIRDLEKNGWVSFFKRKSTRSMLLHGDCSISNLLKIVVGNELFYEQYLFDQQFSHHGWSGFVSANEDHPESLLDQRKISLYDLIVFELLLEIDSLDELLGESWKPLCLEEISEPTELFDNFVMLRHHEVMALWQKAFELSYYDEVLGGIKASKHHQHSVKPTKSFQAVFCIDERECSIRRHIEATDRNCETFGAPGFFGVEFYFLAENSHFYDKLCPAPVTPKYLVKESGSGHHRKSDWIYSPLAHTLFGGLMASVSHGSLSAVRLMRNLLSPKMSPAISDAFAHMNEDASLQFANHDMNDRENDLQLGFNIEEMSLRVENQLRSIGLLSDFAPIVYFVAHGSSSANNPHHGAHDCGACSGRPGSVNARVFSAMANHPEVRQMLKAKGIDIPQSTKFIGALHDTAADNIRFFDVKLLDEKVSKAHQENVIQFETALDLNAKERSRRFASINTKGNLGSVRKAINKRSVSLFEPRPELGHGTNSLCIVGRRDLSKNLFLDRRAFLNSYDYRTDPEGKILPNVMRPLGPVCGGINLEYYFSRVDNYRIGAGTKLPHNVVGLFAVANSSDGDLRPGLPLQMIEVHDPVRLLIIVEHFPEVVLKAIQSSPEMYEWYINKWVHLAAIHPDTGECYLFGDGKFELYQPTQRSIPVLQDFTKTVESAIKMKTNRIHDATKENLPVHLLN